MIIFGQRDYSIRVWLDPQKMAAHGINAGDVADAIAGQNLDVPAGRIGQPPASPASPSTCRSTRWAGSRRRNNSPTSSSKSTKGFPPRQPAAATAPAARSGSGPAQSLVSSQSDTGRLRGQRPWERPDGAELSVQSAANATTTGSRHQQRTRPADSDGGRVGHRRRRRHRRRREHRRRRDRRRRDSRRGTPTSGWQPPSDTVCRQRPSAAARPAELPACRSTAKRPASSPPARGRGTALSGTPRSPSASIVRLRDVGRVEAGRPELSPGHDLRRPSVGRPGRSFSFPGPTPWTSPIGCKAKMEELRSEFPEGVDYEIAYDTTPFIRESVADVVHDPVRGRGAGRPGGAGLLCKIGGSVLIPMVAVPVAIVGTLRRHGGRGLQPEQHLAVRAGAGHRHRRRRRHRGGGERRALAGARLGAARGRPTRRWTKSPAR